MMWTAGAEEDDEESESMGLGVESDMAMMIISANDNGLNNEMFMSSFIYLLIN